MDYKSLLTKVEKTLAQIESAGTRRVTIIYPTLLGLLGVKAPYQLDGMELK